MQAVTMAVLECQTFGVVAVARLVALLPPSAGVHFLAAVVAPVGIQATLTLVAKALGEALVAA
jgi:hypothetical protein